MGPKGGFEGAGLHVGYNARRIAQQLELGTIGTVTPPRDQNLRDKAVTVGFEPLSQPFECRAVAGIVLGQRGACGQQREASIDVGQRRGDGLGRGEQWLFAATFDEGVCNSIQTAKRRTRCQCPRGQLRGPGFDVSALRNQVARGKAVEQRVSEYRAKEHHGADPQEACLASTPCAPQSHPEQHGHNDCSRAGTEHHQRQRSSRDVKSGNQVTRTEHHISRDDRSRALPQAVCRSRRHEATPQKRPRVVMISVSCSEVANIWRTVASRETARTFPLVPRSSE